MATTLTAQNKQTLKRLLKTGRWNNESEIMRYGLHLVAQEVDRSTNPLIRPPRRQMTDEEYQQHIEARAGTWKGANGEKLLKKLRK